MRTQNFQMLSSVLLALAAVAVSADPGRADGPPETPRFFAQWTGLDATCPDWEAEGSKRIVAHRKGQISDVIEFMTPGGSWPDEYAIVRDADTNVIIDLRSTRWVLMPVLHVADSGTEEINDIYWLQEDLDGNGELDPIKPGMTAPTGPDGAVLNLVTIRIARIDSGDQDNAGKYYVTPEGNSKFCIAVGMFQK